MWQIMKNIFYTIKKNFKIFTSEESLWALGKLRFAFGLWFLIAMCPLLSFYLTYIFISALVTDVPLKQFISFTIGYWSGFIVEFIRFHVVLFFAALLISLTVKTE